MPRSYGIVPFDRAFGPPLDIINPGDHEDGFSAQVDALACNGMIYIRYLDSLLIAIITLLGEGEDDGVATYGCSIARLGNATT